MRAAAVDCGTNSLKLLVADLDPDAGGQHELVREQRIVRLGQGVDRTGALAADAVARTLAAADDYAASIAALRVDGVAVAATSAVRDAANGAVLVAGLRDRLGVDPIVLSGRDEAALSYAGAVRGLAAQAGAALLLVDIGGGSTELVRGDGPEVVAVGSADIGSVRLTERHLHDDPPTAEQVRRAVADVEAALDGLAVAADGVDAVVAVGGTAMTVAAYAAGLDDLDLARLHGIRLSAEAVRSACAALLAAPVARRRGLPFMHPGRADVIGAGALVLDRVLRRTGAADVVPSGQDVVDGLAWTLVR